MRSVTDTMFENDLFNSGSTLFPDLTFFPGLTWFPGCTLSPALRNHRINMDLDIIKSTWIFKSWNHYGPRMARIRIANMNNNIYIYISIYIYPLPQGHPYQAPLFAPGPAAALNLTVKAPPQARGQPQATRRQRWPSRCGSPLLQASRTAPCPTALMMS